MWQLLISDAIREDGQRLFEAACFLALWNTSIFQQVLQVLLSLLSGKTGVVPWQYAAATYIF